MELEFKAVKLNKDSIWLEKLQKYDNQDLKLGQVKDLKNEFNNEFIIVGEDEIKEEEYFKVHYITQNGLVLFGGVDIVTMSLLIPKKEFVWDGESYTVIEVPKEFLNLDIVENIQKLNSK